MIQQVHLLEFMPSKLLDMHAKMNIYECGVFFAVIHEGLGLSR